MREERLPGAIGRRERGSSAARRPGAAAVAGKAISLSGVSDVLVQLVTANSDRPIGFMIAVNILFLILGAFFDDNVSIVVIVPLQMPTGHAYGIDPVHSIILVN